MQECALMQEMCLDAATAPAATRWPPAAVAATQAVDLPYLSWGIAAEKPAQLGPSCRTGSTIIVLGPSVNSWATSSPLTVNGTAFAAQTMRMLMHVDTV
jgi:hypothetical protein